MSVMCDVILVGEFIYILIRRVFGNWDCFAYVLPIVLQNVLLLLMSYESVTQNS